MRVALLTAMVQAALDPRVKSQTLQTHTKFQPLFEESKGIEK